MTAATDVPPRLSLRRNVGWSVAGRGYYALTQFAVIAVAARLGTPEDVGALTLAAAVVVPLFFLATMGTRDVLTVDDLDRFGRADYLALRLAGSLAAVAVSVGVALVLYGGAWLVAAAIAAYALVRFFGAQAAMNHAMFQRAERLDYVAASILARATAGVAGFALVFWATRDLPLALLAEALLWMASYWLVDTRLLRRLGMDAPLAALRSTSARRVGALALWVLPVGVALWLMRASASVPPVVLERHVGLAAVGLFGALAYAHTVLSMVANAVGSASAARLRRMAREGRTRAFRRLAARLASASLALGAVALGLAWLVGAPVAALAFGPEYADRDLLVLIVAASVLSLVASPLVTAVTALQAFRWRVAIAGAGFLAAAVAALLLVPPLGATGAALAFLASSAASLVVTLIACAVLLRPRGE